ncbi:unnamed protein product, partial [Discosporangium mesarthrocarpum]
ESKLPDKVQSRKSSVEPVPGKGVEKLLAMFERMSADSARSSITPSSRPGECVPRASSGPLHTGSRAGLISPKVTDTSQGVVVSGGARAQQGDKGDMRQKGVTEAVRGGEAPDVAHLPCMSPLGNSSHAGGGHKRDANGLYTPPPQGETKSTGTSCL